MNDTLATLSSSYLNNGTGDIMLYYSFLETGVVGSGPYTGYLLNESPSSTVGSFNATILEATGSTAASAAAIIDNFILNDQSGGDFRISNLHITPLSGASFLSPSDYDSESTFIFSFEKTNYNEGILFGSLVRDQYSDSNYDFSYGRGFNIGINSRNQLFFQGIDSTIGEYILTANEIELASKNICSVKVRPQELTFTKYNLGEDSFEEQTLRTDVKIQNVEWSENFYIGGSPTFLRNGKTFSGAIDEFMLLSGYQPSTNLKSVVSGFIATGIQSSGASYTKEVLTGQEISLIYPEYVTGYSASITGYSSVKNSSDLIQFVLSPSNTSLNEGDKFLTGYSLPNNSGDYLEETSFLIRDNLYNTTGDDAFATRGLRDSGDTVEQYTLQSTKLVSTSNSLPLYEITPITGILYSEPTGYSKTFVSQQLLLTGNISEQLSFKENFAESYRHNYIYYLSERV